MASAGVSLAILFQCALCMGFLSMVYQHAFNTDITYPTLDSLDKRLSFAFRWLAVSVVPVIVGILSVGTN